MFKRFKKGESKNIQNPPDEVEDLEVLNEFEAKISFTERLRKWRKGLKNTIAFRFALTLLFILFLFFSVLSFILIRSIGNDNIETYAAFSSSLAERTSSVISYWLDGFFKDLRVFSKSDAFLTGDISTAREYMLSNTRLIGSNFDFVAFADMNGDMYSSDGRTGNVSDKLYYSEIAGKGKPQYISNPELSVDGSYYVFYVAVPLYNTNNAYWGVFFAAIPLRTVNNEIQGTKTTEDSYIYAIDGEGNIIAHPDEERIMKNFYTMGDAQSGLEGYQQMTGKMVMSQTGSAVITETDTKVKHHVFYTPIYRTDWSLAVSVPDGSVKASAYKSGLRIIFCTSVIALLLLIFTSVYMNILIHPLIKLKNSIIEIASGDADLTKRIDVHTKNEIGDVVRGFNSFTENLCYIITRIKESKDKLESVDNEMHNTSLETGSSIDQIIQNIEQVSSQINLQGESVEETVKQVNQIAKNIEDLNNLIENQSSGVTQASAAVEQMLGNITSVSRSTEHMVDAFSQLEQHTRDGISKQNSVNEQITLMEEQSQMLFEANKTISKIAGETNLLAMNAAIEAAHAGAAGRGFSVVADEIRALSENSSQQSKRIGNELKKIQESIKNVVQSSAEAKQSFNSVTEQIRATDQLVNQIKGAMEESEIGSHQITDALKMMNDSTSEVRASSADMSSGNSAILSQINKLQSVTQQIKASMGGMTESANRINQNGQTLASISDTMQDSIEKIGSQIDLFKV